MGFSNSSLAHNISWNGLKRMAHGTLKIIYSFSGDGKRPNCSKIGIFTLTILGSSLGATF